MQSDSDKGERLLPATSALAVPVMSLRETHHVIGGFSILIITQGLLGLLASSPVAWDWFCLSMAFFAVSSPTSAGRELCGTPLLEFFLSLSEAGSAIVD